MQLLQECRGDEIWSLDTCRTMGIPDEWLEELADCHESGFLFEQQQIWSEGRLVNQYQGISDVKLALKLADILGIQTSRWIHEPITPHELVRRIKDELDEL